MPDEMTPDQVAEGAALFAMLSKLAPEIQKIKGVSSKRSAVGMAKRRFKITIKKDDEAVKAQVKALIASQCDLEVDFIVEKT